MLFGSWFSGVFVMANLLGLADSFGGSLTVDIHLFGCLSFVHFSNLSWFGL
jgi:hypothetical protein